MQEGASAAQLVAASEQGQRQQGAGGAGGGRHAQGQPGRDVAYAEKVLYSTGLPLC